VILLFIRVSPFTLLVVINLQTSHKNYESPSIVLTKTRGKEVEKGSGRRKIFLIGEIAAVLAEPRILTQSLVVSMLACRRIGFPGSVRRLQPDNHMDTSPDVTQLLLAWSDGDREALERLTPLVYRELKKLAESYLRRERAGHTLQPTALAHEAYIKLIDQQNVHWQNRAHFFGIAAQAMRRILVDHARSRLAGKRGGGAVVSLDEAVDVSDQRAGQLLALDEALKTLAELDPQQSRVVELKYFGGMTLEETAEALGISRATVIREWRMAKAWLYDELNKSS
jgi:RNA polymerase sigma factor (TIGR02999 family)